MMRMHGPMPPSWGPQMPPGPGMEDPNMMGPGGMMPNGPYQPGGPGPRMMGGWPGLGCGGPHPHSHGQMGPCGYRPSMMDMENEMMMAGHHNPNISSSQIPDENLTLEQRQHRAKGLSQLTKIHQMLMGGNGQHDGGQPPMGPDGHPGGMYPGGPGMMSQQQQAMMSQQQAMMSQGGMMHPHGMMSPQHQHMMAQQGMSPYGPRGPPGMGPGMNGKEQVGFCLTFVINRIICIRLYCNTYLHLLHAFLNSLTILYCNTYLHYLHTFLNSLTVFFNTLHKIFIVAVLYKVQINSSNVSALYCYLKLPSVPYSSTKKIVKYFMYSSINSAILFVSVPGTA